MSNKGITLPESRFAQQVIIPNISYLPPNFRLTKVQRNEQSRQFLEEQREEKQQQQQNERRKKSKTKKRKYKLKTPKWLKKGWNRTKKAGQAIGNAVAQPVREYITKRKGYQPVEKQNLNPEYTPTDFINPAFGLDTSNSTNERKNQIKSPSHVVMVANGNAGISPPLTLPSSASGVKQFQKQIKNQQSYKKTRRLPKFKLPNPFKRTQKKTSRKFQPGNGFENPMIGLDSKDKINKVINQIKEYQQFYWLIHNINKDSHYLNDVINKNEHLVKIGQGKSLLVKLLEGENINRDLNSLINPVRFFQQISNPPTWTPETITITSMFDYIENDIRMFRTSQQMEKVFIAILLSPKFAFLKYEKEFYNTNLRTIYDSLYESLAANDGIKTITEEYIQNLRDEPNSLLHHFINEYNSHKTINNPKN